SLSAGRSDDGRRRTWSWISQRRPYLLLGLVVVPFAEVTITDRSVPIDQVVRRPEPVPESVPDGALVVDHNGITDVKVLYRLRHARWLAFEGKFRRVDTDDYQPGIVIFPRPRVDVRDGTQTIDARVRPEIEQHHFAAKAIRRQRVAVEPRTRPV